MPRRGQPAKPGASPGRGNPEVVKMVSVVKFEFEYCPNCGAKLADEDPDTCPNCNWENEWLSREILFELDGGVFGF